LSFVRFIGGSANGASVRWRLCLRCLTFLKQEFSYSKCKPIAINPIRSHTSNSRITTCFYCP
jgi:hypothetical protein